MCCLGLPHLAPSSTEGNGSCEYTFSALTRLTVSIFGQVNRTSGRITSVFALLPIRCIHNRPLGGATVAACTHGGFHRCLPRLCTIAARWLHRGVDVHVVPNSGTAPDVCQSGPVRITGQGYLTERGQVHQRLCLQ